MRKLKLLSILFLSVLIIGVVCAEVESLPPQKINNNVELKQIGADFIQCNITSVSNENNSNIINDVGMTKRGNEYNYTLDSAYVNEYGDHIVNGFCTNGSDEIVWAYDFPVTATGEKVGLSNTVLVFVFLFLAAVFLVLGYSFSKEHWIMKSFFNFCCVGMGILAINTARIISSESPNLGTMGTAGLVLMISVFSIFFLWIFVYAFKEIIKAMQEKRGVRWN